MGAYYSATLENKRYNAWQTKNGAKLMEHGFVGNNYVENVMFLLLENPKSLQWLCDYTEEGKTWDNTKETTLPEDSYPLGGLYLILNHTKKFKIDMKKFICINKLRDFQVHPLPILCNSETNQMGGGDFYSEESLRGAWKGDIIEVTYNEDKCAEYLDVTQDCVFYE